MQLTTTLTCNFAILAGSEKQIRYLWNWVFTGKSLIYWVFAFSVGYL